jgi:hypothetical protein
MTKIKTWFLGPKTWQKQDGLGVLGVGALLLFGSIAAACNTPNSGASTATPAAEATRTPESTVDVTLSGNGSSSASYYLDGSYSVTITVYHSSEQCRLALYAREAGDSIGTDIARLVVFGNTGTFPEYSQTFDWDSAYFLEESVRIVSESACEKVRLQLRRE